MLSHSFSVYLMFLSWWHVNQWWLCQSEWYLALFILWDVSLYQSSQPYNLAVSRLFILILPRYCTYLDTHFLRAPSVLFLPVSLQKAPSWTEVFWSCWSDLPSMECLQKSHTDEKRTRLSTDFIRWSASWKCDVWGQSLVFRFYFQFLSYRITLWWYSAFQKTFRFCKSP